MKQLSFCWSKVILVLVFSTGIVFQSASQQKSVARLWNEVLLEGIRNDFARPTIHARNLFHISSAMYDAWAVYEETASPYFLGQEHEGFSVELRKFPRPTDIEAARREAISYACYRLISHRFLRSPGWTKVNELMSHLMDSLGYDVSVTDIDYTSGSPAALGNYLAQSIIEFGLQDRSNERQNYASQYYTSVNSPLNLQQPDSAIDVSDPNRWQPLKFETFIDQSGNEIPGGTPAFLGPEWGNVIPFSLSESDRDTLLRDGNVYVVYHDPGNPCFLDGEGNASSYDYRWTFELVAIWSSHLDPSDGVMWDISPRSIGNIQTYPESYTDHDQFYDLENGGEMKNIASGFSVNPATGRPYEPQIVPRGDYTRVLAEFWADGPQSETPPGHWFSILNYVSDHPLHERRFKGEGNIVENLEWDVKAYFLLGGAMHDAAISAWGIKGYYDFVRPITAIRYMASKGQSSDPSLPNYNPQGLTLREGFIEIVTEDDPLAGENGEHIGEIKVKAWKGHDYISVGETDQAGVGWILAKNWWPYQRPSFVTPPFAGYISGHSTFSSAAATVLTLLTGNEYFPGGMSEFKAKKNEFLVFEEGPSVDVTLQWATYYDASDQCSLSRIWGGIHPPVDDMPGRVIGRKIGSQAFDLAFRYFEDKIILSVNSQEKALGLYPNPTRAGQSVKILSAVPIQEVSIISIDGKEVIANVTRDTADEQNVSLNTNDLKPGLYVIKVWTRDRYYLSRLILAD